MIIERYSHVMHIVSNVEGKKLDNVDYLEALLSGFSCWNSQWCSKDKSNGNNR